ncbi:hypothetical protein ACH4F6_37070 [Streptomyces sp. NPDC017936]|uniref:hypothetical protein n=1 Tax=Streptomyces sp. NPDC017936 TaxID=3365016 RepID=UPI00379BA7E2
MICASPAQKAARGQQPKTAVADETGAQACPPDVWYKVVSSGASYEAIGSTAGRYNASSTASTLRYDLTATKSKQTSWGAELGGA